MIYAYFGISNINFEFVALLEYLSRCGNDHLDSAGHLPCIEPLVSPTIASELYQK